MTQTVRLGVLLVLTATLGACVVSIIDRAVDALATFSRR